MIDESISQRIVQSALEHRHGNNLLEIGPGKGALTKFFLKERDINYKAVEADWEMIHFLQQNFEIGSDQLIQFDFLKMPLESVFQNEEFNVVGNFPYNISSQILFKLDKYKDCVPTVMGMFQKEVAERIAANPGSKTYGVISVLLQASYSPKILFKVNPGSFFPAPKVKSAVILLERKEDYHLPCNEKLFRSIVKGTFNQRRKMLRNTLKGFIRDKNLLDLEIMTQRPEQLSLEQFYSLTNQIELQLA